MTAPRGSAAPALRWFWAFVGDLGSRMLRAAVERGAFDDGTRRYIAALEARLAEEQAKHRLTIDHYGSALPCVWRSGCRRPVVCSIEHYCVGGSEMETDVPGLDEAQGKLQP